MRPSTASLPSVAGNTYDKYGTRNPLARRLMRGFESSLTELLRMLEPPRTVLEVGCGEGELLHKLAELFPQAELLGTDVSPDIIAEARRRHPDLTFRVLSAYDVAREGKTYDLVVAAEVFEHLEEPARALEVIRSVAGRAIFASVPREPLWRAMNCLRAKYLSALGNTPGHLQHWGRSDFLAFLSTQVDVLAWRSPLPWTQALCRPRPR